MTRILKLLGLTAVLTLTAATASAMSFTHYASSEKDGFWVKSRLKTAGAVPESQSDIAIEEDAGNTPIVTFKGWGTCFNELGWDALQILPEEKQNDLLKRILPPTAT